VAKAAPTTAAKKAAPIAVAVRGNGARYTTNELSSAVRKAGLTIEFTPVVMAPANIGRGPAKEFKVDAMVARLRGSNGGLINERGPGTTFTTTRRASLPSRFSRSSAAGHSTTS
jgi:hypothetical protein